MGAQHWSHKLLVYPLAVCALIAIAYLQQISAPDYLNSFPSPLRDHANGLSLSHDPDALRPMIELHPKDHVYREPTTQHLDWVVGSRDLRPDGVLKRTYQINGLFPGPTIEARSGDTLVITVTNSLEDESLSIHWHGLHVQSAMDGAAGVSQCPVAPGSKFIYNIAIPENQSGTFWYHAHSGVARADGLYGGFVVHAPANKPTVRGLMAREDRVDPPHSYDKDLLLLIGDWYHRSAVEILDWYMQAGSFGNEPVPDSLLINGVGRFECSMAVPARPLDCIEKNPDLSYLAMDEGSSYRIRVVNTGSLAGFTLAFNHGILNVLQLDSIDVEPQAEANTAGVLYPGQRMDAILRPSSNSTHAQKPTSMTIQLDEGDFKYVNPALTPNQTFRITDDDTLSPSNFHTTINLETSTSSQTILSSLPQHADQTHLLYTKIEKLSRNHNAPYGFFNRTSWKPQRKPPQPLLQLPHAKWDENQFSVSTGPEPIWVDLVVNNLDEGAHPFHLHGHHFFVLHVHKAALGWGSYNPFADAYPPGLYPSDYSNQPYNLSRALLRDTVVIPSRGYAVLRFRAENPGVWLFHCHVVWHLANGMAMVVDVMGEGRDVQFSPDQEC